MFPSLQAARALTRKASGGVARPLTNRPALKRNNRIPLQRYLGNPWAVAAGHSCSRRLLHSTNVALMSEMEEIKGTVRELSKRQQTPVSIASYAEFKTPTKEKTVTMCRFMLHELPIRISHIMKTIEQLPAELRVNPNMQRVYGWYVETLRQLLDFKRDNPLDQKGDELDKQLEISTDFVKVCESVLNRHRGVVMTVHEALKEYTETYSDQDNSDRIQSFMDRLFLSRIGTRLMLSHYMEVVMGDERASGLFDESVDVKHLVEEAAANARMLCVNTYMDAPDVEVQICYPINATEEDKAAPLTFPYVPSHLYHIVFELLKNSMRAIVEYYGEDCDDFPPIQVVIVKAKEDLTIKIIDLGGGVMRSDMTKVFGYSYTTAAHPAHDVEALSADMNHAPLAGFGYGLPLCRVYAQFFGGDIKLISTEGHGTDSYIYLKSVASDARESLHIHRSIKRDSFADL